MRFHLCLLATILLAVTLHGEVIRLNNDNLRSTLSSHELVLVNFYADWCRFSQMLAPIFEETAKHVSANIDPSNQRLVLAKVDCEVEKDIAREYGVSKYPTIKLFRFGEVSKKEYRGQRSVEAISAFLQEQLRDVLFVHLSPAEFQPPQSEATPGVRSVVAYVRQGSVAYDVYRRAASKYRTTPCAFHAVFMPSAPVELQHRIGDNTIEMHFGEEEWVGALNFETNSLDRFVGDFANYDLLATFILNKCEPLIRELTFENAEELTEEGLPFLLLFYHPDQESTDLKRRFKAAVEKEILHERYNMNFLTADGIKFEHPLQHMGRSAADLPLIAIDSFKHIYLFPQNVREFLENPNGQLKQFVDDNNSGKLHQELHEREQQQMQANGMQVQTYTVNINGQQVVVQQVVGAGGHPQHPHPHPPQIAPGEPAADPTKDAVVDPAANQNKQVFESVFKKLGPSKQRYTLVKEEL